MVEDHDLGFFRAGLELLQDFIARCRSACSNRAGPHPNWKTCRGHESSDPSRYISAASPSLARQTSLETGGLVHQMRDEVGSAVRIVNANQYFLSNLTLNSSLGASLTYLPGKWVRVKEVKFSACHKTRISYSDCLL